MVEYKWQNMDAMTFIVAMTGYKWYDIDAMALHKFDDMIWISRSKWQNIQAMTGCKS